jgi:hypothetical protein
MQGQRWCALSTSMYDAPVHDTPAGHDNQALQPLHAPARPLAVVQAHVAAALRALGCDRLSRQSLGEQGGGTGTRSPPALAFAQNDGGGLLLLVTVHFPLPAASIGCSDVGLAGYGTEPLRYEVRISVIQEQTCIRRECVETRGADGPDSTGVNIETQVRARAFLRASTDVVCISHLSFHRVH